MQHQSWPLRHQFTIARGSRIQADVIELCITEGLVTGRGECVPYARYGESIDSVLSQINAVLPLIEAGETRLNLNHVLPAGAARNAIDCALWDLEANLVAQKVSHLTGFKEPSGCQTAQTISLAEPAMMAKEAAEFKGYPLLKLKLGAQNILDSVRCVKAVTPQAKYIIDANEAWDIASLNAVSQQLKAMDVVLIEQPLAAESDEDLGQYNQQVPLCADESFHVAADVEKVKPYYKFVNIKLDKTGGLTEAISAVKTAQANQLGIMVGCMVATSLAMAPAFVLAGVAAYVDLDGPALLAKDRINGFAYTNGSMVKRQPFLWGHY